MRLNNLKTDSAKKKRERELKGQGLVEKLLGIQKNYQRR